MTKRTWVEVQCDECGCACHYKPGNVEASARKDGWVITRSGLHFCDRKCLDLYSQNNLHTQPHSGGKD